MSSSPQSEEDIINACASDDDEAISVCDSLDVTLARGVKLYLEKDHFTLSQQHLNLSEDVVDALDEFISTLKGSEQENVQQEQPETANNGLVSQQNTPTQETGGAHNPAAPQTVLGAFVLLSSLVGARLRVFGGYFCRMIQSQWISWLAFALMLELGQKSLPVKTWWLLKFLWTASVVSLTIETLRWYEIFDTYGFLATHMMPIVYSTDKVEQNIEVIRAGAEILLRGQEPNYNAIMATMIQKPPIYQQVTICIVSVMPGILRDWKRRVELKRVQVLSQVKMRVQAEKNALRAKAESDAVVTRSSETLDEASSST